MKDLLDTVDSIVITSTNEVLVYDKEGMLMGLFIDYFTNKDDAYDYASQFGVPIEEAY